MTILSKLCVPLTRINNNTLGTMLCTKRYSRIITEPLWVKKIPPGGHLYVKYREDCEIGYEYWLHNEDKGYAEGERVSFSKVYESAELDIEPSTSAGPLGFSLVQRIGPMPGRCLVFRLAKSCGMSCFDDPVAIAAPTTPNAANSGQASTTVVAPEVQSMVNPGQDQGDTLAPSTEVDPSVTLDPLDAADAGQVPAPLAPAAANTGQNPGDTLGPLDAADAGQDPDATLAPLVAADPGVELGPPAPVAPGPQGQDASATLAHPALVASDPSPYLGAILPPPIPVQDSGATLAPVPIAAFPGEDPCAILTLPTALVVNPGQATAIVLAPGVQLVVNPGQATTIVLAPPVQLVVDPGLASTTVLAPPVQLVANPCQATTVVLTPQVPLVVDPGQALGTILAHAVAMTFDPGHSSGIASVQSPIPPQAIIASIVIPSEDHAPSPTPLHTPESQLVNNGTHMKQGHNANLASMDLHPEVDEVSY